MQKVAALFLLFTISLWAQPSWYYNLKKPDANTYIGYGQASSEKEAKTLALQDIAAKISVQIKGDFSSSMTLSNGQVDKQVSNTSQQKTQAKIRDYKLMKLSFEEGTYYVALSYENISSLDKFIRKVKAKLPKVNERQNRYLAQTTIAQRLKKSLGVDIDFGLQRKDGLWALTYKGLRVVLDERDFGRFFATVPNRSLQLTTSKGSSKLYEGDVFHFKVRALHDGYISILTVYEDGTVATLVRNIKVQNNITQNIPDQEYESELQAALIKPGIETFDQYVAIYSKKPVILDSFAAADEELITHERYKNFDMLIGLLDDMPFATLKVVTKPR